MQYTRVSSSFQDFLDIGLLLTS